MSHLKHYFIDLSSDIFQFYSDLNLSLKLMIFYREFFRAFIDI
jgi:hypothetical protein